MRSSISALGAARNEWDRIMLKITELRIAMEAAEQALDAAYFADQSRAAIAKAEKSAAAARAAYYAELDAANKLEAQYEAMPDDDANGSTNAGDTFDHATYGDDRFKSTEYWRCAIDSAQMMNDEAARIAKRKAERDAWMAEEAAAAAELDAPAEPVADKLQFLASSATGLDLSDAEDRATFRVRVERRLAPMAVAVIREWVPAAPPTRHAVTRAVADAYIAIATA